jgi:hypothetical protein
MYKSGYTLKLYQIIENDLVNFLHYIPIDYYLDDQWKKIYSPILAELLIRIGSQVDIFFRYWDAVQSKNPGVPLDKLNFGNYKAIDIILDDNDDNIKIIATDETLKPFNNWKRKDLDWWIAYNHVKHNGFDNKTEGNLFYVIESLAALFLLNCTHEDTLIKLEEYGKIEINKPEYLYIKSQLFGYEKITRGKSLFDF